MKKLLLILLTLLLCTGCAAKTAQENPNPADKKESITEEQPENTASLACRTVKGEAFSIALSLPDGWELKEQTPKRDAVLAQALLYCEGKEMAELSVEEYEPVSGVPPQEHYKVAYASLRLGSVAGWEFEPYQPVFAQDGVESCCVSIPLRYMHTPIETISVDDVDKTAQLIAAYAKRIVK